MKKRIYSIVSLLLVAMLLFACGSEKKTPGKQEKPQAPKQITSMADVASIADLQIKFGNELIREMEIGEDYFCEAGRPPETTHTMPDGSTESGEELSIFGLTINCTPEDVVKSLNLSSGQAVLNYEYDPYGDGCTDIRNKVYSGELPDWDELDMLDLYITVFFSYENGKLTLIDLDKTDPDDVSTTFLISFLFLDEPEDYPGASSRCLCGLVCALSSTED